MLARNSDLDDAVNAVREMEDRFNHNYNYPWVFLNDQPFSNNFKLCVSPVLLLLLESVSTCADTPRAPRTQSRISNLVSGPVHFGDIPAEHWHQPPWINETKAREEREKMFKQGVPYSEMISCVFLFYWPRF